MLRLMIVTQLNGGVPAMYLTDMLSDIEARLREAGSQGEKRKILETLCQEDKERHRAQIDRVYQQLGAVDVLAYHQNKQLQQLVASKHFNRLIDSTCIAAGEVGLTSGKITFETPDPARECFLPAAAVSTAEMIRSFLLQDILDDQVGIDGEIEDFENLQTFHDVVERICGFSIGGRKQVLLTLQRKFYLARGFAELLKALHVKLFVLSAFYGGDEICTVFGAHLAGVRSADIQHGKIGLQHAFYKDWPSTPASGFPMVPDFFLVWDKYFSTQVNNGHGPVFGNLRHRPIVAGNPWLWFWKKHLRSRTLPPTEPKTGHERARILFTLQWPFPVKDLKPLPDNLVDAIRSTVNREGPQQDFIRGAYWVFRTHPAMPQEIVDEIRKQLSALPLDNVELQTPVQAHLFDLLMNTDVHVTQYSTVAHEACAVGVPTLFTHRYALDNDRDLIDSGRALYVPDSEKIVEALASLWKRAPETGYRNDLRCNADKYPETLREICCSTQEDD